MDMIEFRIIEDRGEWDGFVDSAGGHGLQTWGWGEVKAKHGWTAERVFFERGGEVVGAAQVLLRKLPVFGGMLYVPRGPVVLNEKDRAEVLAGLAKWAQKYRGDVVTLMIEPDWVKMPKGLKDWKKSKNRILLAETVTMDISGDLDGLLAGMPKKRRQDVNKYLRSGLKLTKVTRKTDFVKALGIYKEIAERAGFNLHSDEYYLDIWKEMGGHGWLGVVKDEKRKVIGFQWALMAGGNGFALFAGVGEEGRRRRINAGVKWECLGILKDLGVRHYDFNGLLNEGVNDYKLAFGGEEVELCGAFELALSGKYGLYSRFLPVGKRVVQVLEKIRK